jgi:hypothetical protein
VSCLVDERWPHELLTCHKYPVHYFIQLEDFLVGRQALAEAVIVYFSDLLGCASLQNVIPFGPNDFDDWGEKKPNSSLFCLLVVAAEHKEELVPKPDHNFRIVAD